MSELLPHEIEIINGAINRGLVENSIAADDMAFAASDTNSWHDNAEYDEVITRMKLIDARYSPLLKLIANYVQVEYPHIDDTKVQIGSLIDAEIGKERLSVLVVGQTKEGTQEYIGEWEKLTEKELLVTSVLSPLGSTLRGLQIDEAFSYKVAEKIISGKIYSIDQEWIRRFI